MKTASRARSRKPLALCSLLGIGTLVAALSAPLAQAHGPAIATGGSISIREQAEEHCLDPHKSAITTETDILSSAIDPMIAVDASGHFQPDLATSWAFSANGLQLTMHLRHGVKFSNGDPFDASSVKASFDELLNPATASPTAGLLSSIKQTQVVDPYTVRFVLKQHYRPLLTNLADYDAGVIDVKALQKVGQDKFCQYPIGTGPFKIQNVAPGFSTVTVVRNPLHSWGTPAAHNQGLAHLNQIVFKTIISDATSASELLSGGLDVSITTGDQLSRIKHNAAITLHSVLAQGEFYLGFNLSHAPLGNVDARRAIAEAFDRKQVLQVAANGLGQPAYSPVWTTIPFYDTHSPSYAPSLNLADAQKLATAQRLSAQPLTLLTFTVPETSAAAEFIQAQLQQLGIKTNIVLKSVADFIPLAAKGDYDLLILGIFNDDPDIMYLLFNSTQAAGGGLNFIHSKIPALDNLLDEGRSQLDAKQAAATYAKIQRYIDQNVIVDPLWTPENVYGVRTRVQGWHTATTGHLFYEDLSVSS